MALTRQLLTANEVLAGLSDEQIQAIETLSQNDENSVIGQRIGQIYGDLDNDILSVSGIAKNGTEKTYDYAKRVLGELKQGAAGLKDLQNQLNETQKEKARLEKALAEGAGDAETKKQLAQAQKDLTSIQKQFNDLNTKYQESEKNYQKELFGIRLESELKTATSSLKIKPELPESAAKVLLEQAMTKIKSMNSEYIDDGNGGKVLVFKGENGEIMRNPNNQLNPYSASELMTQELKNMGILDEGRQGAGAGSHDSGGSNGGGSNTFTIAGAKTRVQAYDIIQKSLNDRGLVRGSQEYSDEFDRIWIENNVSSLPEQ